MSHRFVRCPHCKMPHDAAVRVCPTTGRTLGNEAPRGSRMSELPPPERKPEPLGFDPKNRISAQRAAAAAAAGQSGERGTLPPTRSIQAELIGRTVSDRYRILGVLGEGGMGMVYDAEHMGLGRNVAIKVLAPSQAKKRVAVKRFQQEARAAGAIGHPNICEVYDLGQLDDGSPYLVMEKLSGSTLAERITREGGLPFDEIVDVMIQVMSGLIAAHDKGIVHRDIKPENIFLARRVGCPPIVKILDFGVSKMMPQFQGGDEQLDLTRTGMVMGTPYYMSPEQARGERNLDGRVDVYACGVMMYESIAGKRPFLAPNYNALLLAIINTVPRSLREVRPATPPALEAIVARAMSKARDDRYPSANHVLRDLQALQVTLAQGAPQNRMPPPPTADERLRAPQAGARGARASRVEVHEGPGATLRSRMADAHPERRPAHTAGTDPSTRLDIKINRERPKPDSDSIEIPIHVTGSDLSPVQAIPQPRLAQAQPQMPPQVHAHRNASTDFAEDLPTEIFRPDQHASPFAAPRPATGSATQLSPQNFPMQRPAAGMPAAPPRMAVADPRLAPIPQGYAGQVGVPQGAPPNARPASAPPPPPVDISGLVGDDWEVATVVKRPQALSRPKRDAKPFNPDETVAMNGDIDVDVDFDNDSTVAPPSRRR
ncbi:MAG: protein kinase [Deltaproteobacteria bacterium]|nr:protein kinase [Deltaproteobacteria bacterium]